MTTPLIDYTNPANAIGQHYAPYRPSRLESGHFIVPISPDANTQQCPFSRAGIICCLALGILALSATAYLLLKS